MGRASRFISIFKDPLPGDHVARVRVLFVRRSAIAALGIGLIGLFVWLSTTWGGEASPAAPARLSPEPPSQPVACGGAVAESPLPAIKPPARAPLDKGVDYSAIVHTSCGDLKIDLLEEGSPKAVANFISAARSGLFNGLTWDVVDYDFIIQVRTREGDYTFEGEPSRDSRYVYGDVLYSNDESERAFGRGFFVIVHDLEGALKEDPEAVDLPGSYSIFGIVTDRFYGSLDTIARQEVSRSKEPLQPIFIERVEILES